jgi:hypothetical protein
MRFLLCVGVPYRRENSRIFGGKPLKTATSIASPPLTGCAF